MATKFREIPGLLGRVIAGVLLVATGALGDTVLKVEEIGPWLAANNMPDPHFSWAGSRTGPKGWIHVRQPMGSERRARMPDAGWTTSRNRVQVQATRLQPS